MPFIKDIQNSWNMKDGAFLLTFISTCVDKLCDLLCYVVTFMLSTQLSKPFFLILVITLSDKATAVWYFTSRMVTFHTEGEKRDYSWAE